MITCSNVKKLLNAALLKGESSITVNDLTETEQEELVECGYVIKKEKKKYIISH